jgi:hypothetical protein
MCQWEEVTWADQRKHGDNSNSIGTGFSAQALSWKKIKQRKLIFKLAD